MRAYLLGVKLDVQGGTHMGVGVEHPGSPVKHGPRISVVPTTLLGRWAVGLAAAFFVLVVIGIVVPRGGALAVACGLTSGVVALVAIVRERERALTVFAALAPLAFAVGFVIAELIGS